MSSPRSSSALHLVGPSDRRVLLFPAARGARGAARSPRRDARRARELSLGFVYFTGPRRPGRPGRAARAREVLVTGMYAGDAAGRGRSARFARSATRRRLLRRDAIRRVPARSTTRPATATGGRAPRRAARRGDRRDHRRCAEQTRGPSQLFIFAWGGAVAASAPGSRHSAGRDIAFVVHPLFLWEDPADDERSSPRRAAYRDRWSPGRPAPVPELQRRRGQRARARGLRGERRRAARACEGRVGPE